MKSYVNAAALLLWTLCATECHYAICCKLCIQQQLYILLYMCLEDKYYPNIRMEWLYRCTSVSGFETATLYACVVVEVCGELQQPGER